MPRLEFGSKNGFFRWINNRMDPNKYECYMTEDKEIILVPKKSTRPVVYAYLKCKTREDFKDVLTGLKHLKVMMYGIKKFEWKPDASIGTVYTGTD